MNLDYARGRSMTELYTWCLKNSARDEQRKYMPQWWREDKERNCWVNTAGGYHNRQKTDVVHMSVHIRPGVVHFYEALSDEQRTQLRSLAKKRMCRKSNQEGWVTPSGEWFPCGWHNHDWFVEHFFQAPLKDIEQTHARVRGEFWSIQGSVVPEPMKQTLIRLGFVNDGDL